LSPPSEFSFTVKRLIYCALIYCEGKLKYLRWARGAKARLGLNASPFRVKCEANAVV
jgi:hypothetical protein